MSFWLDRKYLESLAKNAIAEAQKTLDKALDIKDEEENETADESAAPVSAVPNPPPAKLVEDQIGKSGSSGLVKSFSNNLGVSGWGSFTGSFFEAAELGKEDGSVDSRKTRRHKNRQKPIEALERGKNKLLKITLARSEGILNDCSVSNSAIFFNVNSFTGVVTSSSEPVSLQPTSTSSSSLLKIVAADKGETDSYVNQPKSDDPVDLIQINSSSSLMEASCETEILELELNRPEVTMKFEPEVSDVISCDLVPVTGIDPLLLSATAAEPDFSDDASLNPPNGMSCRSQSHENAITYKRSSEWSMGEKYFYATGISQCV